MNNDEKRTIRDEIKKAKQIIDEQIAKLDEEEQRSTRHELEKARYLLNSVLSMIGTPAIKKAKAPNKSARKTKSKSKAK